MISKLEILRVRRTFSISFKETQGYWSINNSRNVLVGYQFLFAKDCFLSGQEQACSRTNFGFWVFVVTMPKMASYWKMAIDCVCVLLITFKAFLDQTRPEHPPPGHHHHILTLGLNKTFVPLKCDEKTAN